MTFMCTLRLLGRSAYAVPPLVLRLFAVLWVFLLLLLLLYLLDRLHC